MGLLVGGGGVLWLEDGEKVESSLADVGRYARRWLSGVEVSS